MRKKGLLSSGIFEKKFMVSKVDSRAVSKKEKILGHLIGPLGLIFVVNTIAALVEKFFTQQTGAMYGYDNIEMIQRMGGIYEIIMTISKILAVALGVLTGLLISKTKTKQGRFRPWYLIFGFISIVIGMLIFLLPGNNAQDNYWYYFFTLLVCYHTVGSTFFYTFRDNIVSVSTRNSIEKTQLAFIRKMSWTLISGIIIGMLINSVVLPMWLEKDINGYAILLMGLSIVAIPLLLMEYWYTKERVIDDVCLEKGEENKNKIPLKEQIKALFTNKYFVIIFILTTISGIVDNFKGGNVQYFYIKFMLGGVDNWSMYTIYQVITGVPLGLGAIIAYPLAKRFGIKNITIVGYAMVFIGSVLGWMMPGNLVVAMIAGFLRQFGMIPNAYIFATMLCFAYDHIEYKSGVRLEGLLGVSILMAIQTAIYAPFAGGYEASILKLGFVDVEGVVPSQQILDFMTMSFYLFDIILAAAYLILLPFMDVEKQLPQINKELLNRKKEAILASGGVWIDPEEQDKIEKEKAMKEAEENRIADLKEHCQKRGLDFELENQKYLKRQEEKRAKKR